MKYLTICADLESTGIRDKYSEQNIFPSELGLSCSLIDKISKWILNYNNEHYSGFKNKETIKDLDNEGILIAKLIKFEMKEDCKIEYISDASNLRIFNIE